jgi:hypothetical protein
VAATVHPIFFVNGVAPGTSHGFTWKNLPQGTAYAMDAHPYRVTANYPVGLTVTTEVELTRVWRKTRETEETDQEGFKKLDVHNDISAVYKNVGQQSLDVDFYVIAFS